MSLLKNVKTDMLALNYTNKTTSKNSNVEYNEQSIFRLYFIHYGVIGKGYGHNIQELIDWPYTPFRLPKGMTTRESFLILSCLIQKIERDFNLQECSQKALTILNENLDKFNFTLLPNNTSSVVDLFTVTGNLKRFKKSEHNGKYFEWFEENVSLTDVKNIYSKYGYYFSEPNFKF